MAAVNLGKANIEDFDYSLASIHHTIRTTAILEAGRRSLDSQKSISILYEDVEHPCNPTALKEC